MSGYWYKRTLCIRTQSDNVPTVLHNKLYEVQLKIKCMGYVTEGWGC